MTPQPILKNNSQTTIIQKTPQEYSSYKARQSNLLHAQLPRRDHLISERLLLTQNLTQSASHPNCRVSIVIPVRNESENLPSLIHALAHQQNSKGYPLAHSLYEILLLANNCNDNTVEVACKLRNNYPSLQFHIIEAHLPHQQAHVGKARQMAMDEAYRRLLSLGLKDRIIASTDGDTIVAKDWISSLILEFDKGVDAVGGRITTCRETEQSVSKEMSLYYLRSLAHAFLAVQLECLIDPQSHDCWPRHSQYFGANMALTARAYGQIGGLPLVKDGEDVALYKALRRIDAKIRHSPKVRVITSARQVGRATGGLAEHFKELSLITKTCQFAQVEHPDVTEARILLTKQLRQLWIALQVDQSFNIIRYEKAGQLLANYTGLSTRQLQQAIESASTFGQLLQAVTHLQQPLNIQLSHISVEVRSASLQLRARIKNLQRQTEVRQDLSYQIANPKAILTALQQVQAIPLFSFAN